ncbi:MAG: hypothetical protein ACI90V_003650, partial [Bacillariaceae sp.]
APKFYKMGGRGKRLKMTTTYSKTVVGSIQA